MIKQLYNVMYLGSIEDSRTTKTYEGVVVDILLTFVGPS